MSDTSVLKWLGAIFAIVFLIAIFGNFSDNGKECDNSQYSTQSC